MLLLLVGVAVTVWSFRQIERAAEHRKDSRVVISAMQDLITSLLNAETSERRYALTGDDTYLNRYLAVRDTVLPRFHTLRALSTGRSVQSHVNTIEPLMRAKLAEMETSVALRRSPAGATALLQTNSDADPGLTASIRQEARAVGRVENDLQLQQDMQFDGWIRWLFLLIVGLSALALMLVLGFAYASIRATKKRLENLAEGETQHLLAAQTLTNLRLLETNRILQNSEQKLAITLSSIGDGVIATDAAACVTLLNRVAEDLTGWTHAQALGRPVDEVFHIVNKETRERANIPVADALAHGTVQGLANHTVLIARDGREFDIADSCAPIRDADTQVVGAVLVFRNVTDEYAAQQTLRDSAARVQTILNTVGDGIVTLHAEGGIMESANPAIEHLFGYSAAELIGKGFAC